MPSEVDVLFVPENFSGGYRLRSLWPAQELRKQGWNVGVIVGQFDPSLSPKVAVIHMSLDPRKYLLVRHFHRLGSKVILSEDDNIWQRPHKPPGQDGDIYEATIRSAKEADRIIVTTDALAEFYSRWNSDVQVIPNYLPERVYFIPDGKPKREFPVVGYHGSSRSHQHDIEWLSSEQWERIASDEKSILVTIGDAGIPQADFARGWEPDPWKLYGKVSQWDIGIVPLLPHQFNDAKSWLKALEFATLGVAVVATSTRDNRKLRDLHMPYLCLVQDPENFTRAVNMFKRQTKFRERTAMVNREAASRITLSYRIGEWMRGLTWESS